MTLRGLAKQRAKLRALRLKQSRLDARIAKLVRRLALAGLRRRQGESDNHE